MKKIYIFSTFLIFSVAYSQTGKVGVNETSPQSTMDIKPIAANSAPNATSVEGLLIPRVSRLRAANMGTSVPESTLVYINSVADGAATGTTATIDAVGTTIFQEVYG